MFEKIFDSVREALPIVGKTVVEITCDDKEDSCCNACPGFQHVYIHFDDFSTLTIHIRPGEPGVEVGFHYDGHPGEEDV